MKKVKDIPLLKVQQLNAKPVYLSHMRYSDLKNIVKHTARENDGSEYQRKSDPKRINDIEDFLIEFYNDSKLTSIPFPTPLVLAVTLEDDIDDKEESAIEQYFQSSEGKKAILSDKEKTLFFDDTIEKVLIVDGQHRFKGVEQFLKNHNDLDDFEFSVTLLLDYDLYEQAEVFANINFTQKPVNRSLFYDIFGALPERKNELTFAHFLVKRLNEKGPLKNMVKMLGTGPGTMSLAFFVKTIVEKLISTNGNLYYLFTQYRDSTGTLYTHVSTVLNDYFEFLNQQFRDYFPKPAKATKVIKTYYDKDLFEEYLSVNAFITKYNLNDNEDSLESLREQNLIPDEVVKKLEKKGYSSPYYSAHDYRHSHMMKATGMYGLLLIVNDLFSEINIQDYSEEKFHTFLKDKFELVIQNPDFFFADERFQKSGSAGLQTTFYKMLYSAIFDKELNKH